MPARAARTFLAHAALAGPLAAFVTAAAGGEHEGREDEGEGGGRGRGRGRSGGE